VSQKTITPARFLRAIVGLPVRPEPANALRRFQRLAISVAIGEQRTWLDLLMVPPGRE